MEDQPNDIMVSICCTAYNHEKFIEQTLEGFIMQQCNFKFEILISDDASPDNTASIIKKYEDKYPDLFRVFYLKENQYSKGIKPLFNILFPAAKGKYIAICEGDDYWTDPLKLQKQVDFLEENDEFGSCFTNAIILNQLNNTDYEYNSIYKLNEGEVNNDIIFRYGGSIYPTLSLLFRRDLVNKIKFIEGIAGDECILFCLSNLSKVYFINIITGVYRRWEGGIYSGIMHNKEKILSLRISEIKGYIRLQKYLDKENEIRLRNKKRIKIEYVIENNVLKSLQFIPHYGIRSFLSKILN